MQHIAHKLKSTRGASMVFALLVFALCALAGTVTLVAAAANIGRYTHLVQEEQQYLSAASALDVLQARLDSMEKKVEVEYTVTERWYYTQESDGTMKLHNEANDPGRGLTTYALALVDPTDSTVLSTSDYYFEALLLAHYVPEEWYTKTQTVTGSFHRPSAVYNWSATGGTPSYTVGLDSTAPDWAADTLYPVTVTPQPAAPVAVDLSVVDWNTAFQLEMVLAVTTANSRTVYPVTAVWTPDITTETTTETNTTGDLTAPPWASGATSGGMRETKTTLTVTLRWPAANRTVTFG